RGELLPAVRVPDRAQLSPLPPLSAPAQEPLHQLRQTRRSALVAVPLLRDARPLARAGRKTPDGPETPTAGAAQETARGKRARGRRQPGAAATATNAKERRT